MTVFIDSSAFIALYVRDDAFHSKAIDALKQLQKNNAQLITSNFILDEVYTFLRTRKDKKTAVKFVYFLAETTDVLKVIRVTARDERHAFSYFSSLEGTGISFTDCTSFALMKRSSITTALTFDSDFAQAGFIVLPEK